MCGRRNPDPDCFLYKGGGDQGLISWWIDHDTGQPIPERSGCCGGLCGVMSNSHGPIHQKR